MDRSADPQLHTLVEFLADCKLSHLQESLADETLANLAAEHDAGRQPMLKHLKQKGVDRLIERQNLTNALGRAKKAGRVQPSANDVPPGKPPVGKVVAGTGLDDCGLSKVQPASTAKRINCGVVCCVGDTARNEFEFSLSQRSCTPNVPLPFRRDEVVRLISVESGAAGAQRVLRGENVMVFICTTIRDALCLATKQEQAGVVLITSKSCDEAVQLISTFGSSPPHVSVSTVPPNEPAELRSALHVNMLQAGVMWQEGASPWQDERGMGWLEPPITSTLQSLSSLLRQPTMVPRVLVVEPCTRSASQMKCVLQEIGFLADAVPTAADARRQLAFSLGAAAFYAIVLVETALPGDEDGESGCALHCPISYHALVKIGKTVHKYRPPLFLPFLLPSDSHPSAAFQHISPAPPLSQISLASPPISPTRLVCVLVACPQASLFPPFHPSPRRPPSGRSDSGAWAFSWIDNRTVTARVCRCARVVVSSRCTERLWLDETGSVLHFAHCRARRRRV